MRIKYLSYVTLLLALVVTVPMLQGCQALASYLIYEWIQDEFEDDEDREEPLIEKVVLDREEVHTGDTVLLEVEASDDQDSSSELDYFWVASEGTLIDPTSRITVWQAPNEPGIVTFSVLVVDTDDNEDSQMFEIDVLL